MRRFPLVAVALAGLLAPGLGLATGLGLALGLAVELAPDVAHAQGVEQTVVDRATLAVQEMMTQTVSQDPRIMLQRSRAAMICPRSAQIKPASAGRVAARLTSWSFTRKKSAPTLTTNAKAKANGRPLPDRSVDSAVKRGQTPFISGRWNGTKIKSHCRSTEN